MKFNALLVCMLLITSLPLIPAAPAENEREAPRAGEEPNAPWPTFHGDNGRTGNTSDYGPGTSNMLWSNNTGQNCYGSPVVADGRVWIGSRDNAVYCFNATTGERKWRTATTDEIWGTPVVDLATDRVYVGSQDHSVYCYNATTGAQAWSKALGGVITSSPLLYKGRIYIGCGDWYCGGTDGYLYCLYANNGTQFWRTANAGSCASPAIADGRLFSQNGNQLRCLDPETGGFFWNASITTGYHGGPSAAEGKVVYNAGNGHIFCFNASTGSKDWETTSGYSESESVSAISNGYVYSCVENSDGNPGALKKMYLSNGTVIWTYTTNLCPWSSPAVAGDRVYFAYDRTVLCVNATDKTLVWSYQGAAGDYYGIGGSPAVANGRVYIGGAEAKLYCFGSAGPNYAPAAVTLSPPDTIRDTSLWLRWTQNNDADFSKYELHRSLSPSFAFSAQTLFKTINLRTTTSENVSTGLNHSTTYYFKVRVWDNGDPVMCNDSNEVSATTTTPNGAPTGITLYAPSDITPTSMKLSWSVNSDPDFAKYEVYRGLTSGFALIGSNLVKTVTSSGENSTVVQNLVPWTNYFFKARVYDNGTPALFNTSNEVTARSGNTRPAAVFLNPPAMGATSAMLSWSASTDDDFALYEVYMGRTAGFTPNASTLLTNSTSKLSTEYNIENLQLSKNYYFLVRVLDQGGLFNDSNMENGTTANTIPKPVITSPAEGDTFDTRTIVSFDGTKTSDQDEDALSLYWTSSVDGYLSSNGTFSRLLSEGEHRITLYANDGNGHNASVKVSISVKKAPDRAPGILLLSPRENDEVSGIVSFSGTAWDIDGNGTIVNVQVKHDKVDWKPVTGNTTWSYDWNVSKVANGKQKVYFRTFDGELYSPEVFVTIRINNINLPPGVTITGPSTATPFSKIVTITGSASDPDGPLTKVEVCLNNGAWQTAVGTTSWTYVLDTTGLKNGPHTVQVRSSDGNSNSNVEWLNFTVKNSVAKPTVQEGPSPILFAGIGVIAAVGILAALMMMRRKKGTPAVPPDQSQMVSAPPAQPAAPQQPAPMPPQQPAYQPQPEYQPQGFRSSSPQDYQSPPPQATEGRQGEGDYQSPPPQSYESPPPQSYESPPPPSYDAPPGQNYQQPPPQ